MPSQRNISLLGHPNYFNSGCYDVNVCLFENKKIEEKRIITIKFDSFDENLTGLVILIGTV